MASKVSGLVQKIKSGNITHSVASTAYGVCETVADEAAKIVDMTGFTLLEGTTIHVKFIYNNTASSPTLNINNTGAKPIVQYGTTAVSTSSSTSGWYAGAVVSFTYDGTSWVRDQGFNTNSTYTITSVWCNTAAGIKDKTFSNASYYTANDKSYFEITFRYTNTAQSALTLNGKELYIDGKATSSSNYTLPAGKYLVYYENGIYYIRTDGTITGNITGDAATVNGLTVQTAVPANAVFTDTNKYHKSGSWNGLTYTADAVNEADELKFTIPDSYGDTKNPYGAKGKNLVLAGPSSGSNAVPSFRALVAADIPNLTTYKTRLVGSKVLNAVGWYRILDCTTYSMAFLITFYGGYNNSKPSPVTFLVSHAYSETKISQIGRNAYIGWITKIRAIHHDTSKFYIDLYFAGDKSNQASFEITPLDPNSRTSISLIDYTQITDTLTSNAECSTAVESIADIATAANITSTQYGIAYYSNTAGAFASTGAGTSGQYLKSNGTSAPTWASFPSTWAPSAHNHNASDINDGTLAIARIADSSITNAKLANSSITIGASSVSLGGTLSTITGPLTINTTRNSEKAFQIRGNKNTEIVSHWMTDTTYIIKVTNDDASVYTKFILSAIDTNNNHEGSGAQSSEITFSGLNGKSTVTADYFSGNGSSLTNLNGSNIATGTVPSARLPVATSSAFGAVKTGDGITNTDGVISVTASNLGLSTAMHFLGVSTTAITDGGTENPTIGGTAITTKAAGDVVIDNNSRREYVWSTTNKWEMLGFDASTAYSQTTSGNTFISSVSQATDGTVTAGTRALDTSGTWSGTAAKATADASGNTITTTYVPMKTGANDINTIVNTGIYNITSGSATNGPKGYGYGQLLVMSYRKHTGNTTTDWASQIYLHNGGGSESGSATAPGNVLYYRTSGTSSSNTWFSWRKAVHAPAAYTAIGNSAIPVYISQSGEAIACTDCAAIEIIRLST